MIDQDEIRNLYPQIYLACHVDHVRSSFTTWRRSSRDSSILWHLSRRRATSPRELGMLGPTRTVPRARDAGVTSCAWVKSN